MINQKKVGLSLSGGGYRAAAYHLGTLKKLKEMGVLDKIDVLSTVSGGSITGAAYCLRSVGFEQFEKEFRKGLKRNIITNVLLSSRFVLIVLGILLYISGFLFLYFKLLIWPALVFLVLMPIILIYFQFKIFPVSRIIERLYSSYFFKKATLDTLVENPTLVINSTNLETGRLFTFARDEMGDSKYEYLKKSKPKEVFKTLGFPVSRAVIASSSVPFAFTPISIAKKFFISTKDAKKFKPRLVDGGVYDNQGIHKITFQGRYKCDIVVTSDAGNLLPQISKFRNTLTLLIRTCDIFMNRIKNFQIIDNLYENVFEDKREIAYQSLGWDVQKCIGGFIRNLKKGLIIQTVIDLHGIKEMVIQKKWEEIENKLKADLHYEEILRKAPNSQELEIARSVATSLNGLSDVQIDSLMKQATVMTELQIKLYCPTLNRGRT